MTKKRIFWLDIARSIAIFFVVLIHSLETVYDTSPAFIMSCSEASKAFFFNVFNLSRHAVPLFLMITGYLILSKKFVLTNKATDDSEITCVHFWKHSCLRLLLTVEIWIVIYNLFSTFFNREEFDVLHLIKTLLFLEEVGEMYLHQWYIYMIVGVYVFLPVLAVLLSKMDLKVLAVLLVITGVCNFALPTVNIILAALKQPTLHSLLDVTFTGGIYGLYIILGYLAYRGVFRKIAARYLIIISAISFTVGTALQYFSYYNAYEYLIWYDCLTLLPTAISVFELLSRTNLKESRLSKMCACLSRCSFGIYLVHMLILRLTTHYIPLDFKLPINTVVYSVVVLLLSWLLVYAVSRIPKVGKILFYT